MPKLTGETRQYKLTRLDKQAFYSWYDGVLQEQLEALRASEITDANGFKDAKTNKRVLLRNMEAEHVQLRKDFKEKLDKIPGAYFELLNKLVQNEDVKEDMDSEKDAEYMNAAFLEKNHSEIHRYLDRMADGLLEIKNPKELADRYLQNNPMRDLGFEEISEETIAATPEIKDSDRYTDKDRQIEYKKAIQALERAEEERLEERSNLQSHAKGVRDYHVRRFLTEEDIKVHPLEAGETLEMRLQTFTPSRSKKREYERKYGNFDKENKKLDAANDAYYKAKLALDKLTVKAAIFGELTPREAAKQQELMTKCTNAAAALATTKDQMIKNYAENLVKEGKNPMSDLAKLRIDQIKSGDTTYMILESVDATKMEYPDAFGTLDIDSNTVTNAPPVIWRRSVETEVNEKINQPMAQQNEVGDVDLGREHQKGEHSQPNPTKKEIVLE